MIPLVLAFFPKYLDTLRYEHTLRVIKKTPGKKSLAANTI